HSTSPLSLHDALPISGLSNCKRKAPVDTGVVSVHSAARFSSRTTSNPAREAKNAVAAPTIPPPITTRSAVVGNASATRSRGQGRSEEHTSELQSLTNL